MLLHFMTAGQQYNFSGIAVSCSPRVLEKALEEEAVGKDPSSDPIRC